MQFKKIEDIPDTHWYNQWVEKRDKVSSGLGLTIPSGFSNDDSSILEKPLTKRNETLLRKLVNCGGCGFLMCPNNPDRWNCESGCLLCEDCGYIVQTKPRPPNGYLIDGNIRKELCPCCNKMEKKERCYQRIGSGSVKSPFIFHSNRLLCRIPKML